MFAGIDIGRSAIKAVGPRATWIGPTGLLAGHPSRGPIAPLETGKTKTTETDEVLIKIGQQTWTLTDWGGATYDLSPHKTREGTALALLGALGALLIAENTPETTEDKITIATGLPAALMEADAQPLGQQVSRLVREGVTVSWKGQTVHIPQRFRLLVFAEGDGIWKAAQKEGIAETEGLVIDMGHVTTNIVEYRRSGERIRAFSIPKGGADVFRKFSNTIARKGGPLMGYGRTQWLVKEMLAGRITHIDTEDGHHVDLREIFRESAQDFFSRELLPEVLAILGDYAAFGLLISAGGGAEIFPIQNALPRARVLPEPRLAQARGYALLAAEYAEEKSLP